MPQSLEAFRGNGKKPKVVPTRVTLTWNGRRSHRCATSLTSSETTHQRSWQRPVGTGRRERSTREGLNPAHILVVMPVRTAFCTNGHRVSVLLDVRTPGDEDERTMPCPCAGCTETLHFSDAGHRRSTSGARRSHRSPRDGASAELDGFARCERRHDLLVDGVGRLVEVEQLEEWGEHPLDERNEVSV